LKSAENKNVMKIKQSLWILIIFLTSFTVSQGQIVKKSVPQPSTSNFSAQAVKSSPAYAELLLRKTEREAQLEEFLLDYTEEFPKVKEIKFELGILQKQLDKVSAVSLSDAPKLSLALGKLLVRKTELDVELWNLLGQYNADHPEVKRTKRKLEVYEAAIKEILP
jgi:uncharacterized protein involved in exopolysaccharide biosynthesis